MKLRFFSTIQASADLTIAALQGITRCVQAVRVWAWTNATRENVRTCNSRAAKSEVLS